MMEPETELVQAKEERGLKMNESDGNSQIDFFRGDRNRFGTFGKPGLSLPGRFAITALICAVVGYYMAISSPDGALALGDPALDKADGKHMFNAAPREAATKRTEAADSKYRTKKTAADDAAKAVEKETAATVPQRVYGISCEGMTLIRSEVKSGQSLAEILLKADVPYGRINEAVSRCEGIFDVRKIRIGNAYAVLHDAATGEARHFVYEKDAVSYVVFDLGETVSVHEKQKPVETRLRLAEGEINPSLSVAFSRLGLEFELVQQLAEIYAWTLDFYHFQNEDRFKIIYEEKRVDGEPVGYGRIRAARITTRGEDFYAFYFAESEEAEGRYYDENGRSLRKAFLKAPLKYFRISSTYSKKRLHPILGYARPHLGIDYAAPTGTPVMSVGDGVVEKAAYNRSMGYFIRIRHTDRYSSQYLHLSGFADSIRPGARVEQGQIIGQVGSTGLSTGPHLDFRFWVDGEAVNYLKHDIPTAEPVRPEKMAYFTSWANVWLAELDRDTFRLTMEDRVRPLGPKG